MKCPNCKAKVGKGEDCTSCNVWNGAGREPQSEAFPFGLDMHEAVRTNSMRKLAMEIMTAGVSTYETKDDQGRTAEEYAMYMGNLKALKKLRAHGGMARRREGRTKAASKVDNWLLRLFLPKD